MKPITLLLIPLILFSCVPPDTELTTISAAFAYNYEPQEINRVEIDINGKTYKILAHNVPGGVISEPEYLPSGTVTRVVFYLYQDAVYEVKPLGWDSRTVVGTPFYFYGGETLGVQVYLID